MLIDLVGAEVAYDFGPGNFDKSFLLELVLQLNIFYINCVANYTTPFEAKPAIFSLVKRYFSFIKTHRRLRSIPCFL